MTSGLLVSAVTMRSYQDDPAATFAKSRPFLARAAAQGAGLVCFSEQHATGWDPRSSAWVESIDGSIVSGYRALAEEYGVAIVGSFRERTEGLPRNTAVVIEPDGEVLATYAKTHLFTLAGEDEAYSVGDSLRAFEYRGIKFGLAICFDLRFSYVFSKYRDAGVECMLVPAAWPCSRIGYWSLFLRSRALDNQFYVCGVNTTGTTTLGNYCGRSMIVDPLGEVLAESGAEEGVITALVEKRRVAEIRAGMPVEASFHPGL